MIRVIAFTSLMVMVGCTSNFEVDPALRNLSSEAPPDSGSSVYGLDFLMQEKNRGRALYTQHCQACHLPVESSLKSGRKAEEIKSALITVSQMQALSLSNADAFALELALTSKALTSFLTDPRVPTPPNNPGNPGTPTNPENPGGPVNPTPPPPPLTDLTCRAGDEPGPTFVNRLSKKQLKYVWANLNIIGLGRDHITEMVNSSRGSGVAFGLVPNDHKQYDGFSRQDQTVTSFHVDAHFLTAVVGAGEFAQQTSFSGYGCMNSLDTATVTCIKDFIRGTGLHALRRPLTVEEVEDYYNLMTQGTSRRDGLKMLMAAFALAPQLMFQIETEGQLKEGSSDVLKLTDYEIASRLALAVSGRPPTAAMYQAAANGRFSNPQTLNLEIDALYAGINRATRQPVDDTHYAIDKVQQTYRQFAEEWLHLDQTPVPIPEGALFDKLRDDDPDTYRTWTFTSNHLFDETHELIHRQFWSGGNFAKLMTDREFFSAGDHIYGIYGYVKTRNNTCAYRYARASDNISSPTTYDRYLEAKYRMFPGGPELKGKLQEVPAGAEIIERETTDAQNRIRDYKGNLVESLIVDYYRSPANQAFKEVEHACNNNDHALGSARDRVYTHDPNRAGLLTRAGMLYQPRTDTNPISRGVFIRRQILCDDLKNPDADRLPDRALDAPEAHPDFTTRERYTAKTSPPLCMSCHIQINPLGFALEDFDILGRKRTTENIYSVEVSGNQTQVRTLRTLPINASVPSLELTPNDGLSANGAVAMSQVLAVSPKANACVARQVFRFMTAKKETTGDACVISNMYDNLTAQSGSFEKMFKGFVQHEHFRLRKVGPQQ